MQSDENRDAASILVVEDDEDVREAMVAFLQMKGYSVASACNGKEALDYLFAAPAPDLIIAAIPMLVITAMADRTHIDASEILLKPVDADLLLTAVSRHCGSEPALQ